MSLVGATPNGTAPNLTSYEKPRFVWSSLEFVMVSNPTMEPFTAGLCVLASRKEASMLASTTVEGRWPANITGAFILLE